MHERNPNYWRSGEPYFDTVHIIDFTDSTAQVNALLGGQIDAMTDLPASQVKVRPGRGIARADLQDRRLAAALHGDRHAAVRRPQGPAGHAADRRPAADDARRSLSGYGFVGNDLYAPFDAGYDASACRSASRTSQQAKSLLKSAGKEGLTSTCTPPTARPAWSSWPPCSPTQAKEAGVTVNVQERPELLRQLST